MAIIANPTLDDGTTTITLRMEDKNDDPQIRIAEQEIVGGKGDKSSGMGRGNRKITGTIVVHKSNPVNGSAVGDIDTVEDQLVAWGENGTVLTYTEDDGSSTFDCRIVVDFDKPDNITPNLIRANIKIVEDN